jgi:hypothetical protein
MLKIYTINTSIRVSSDEIEMRAKKQLFMSTVTIVSKIPNKKGEILIRIKILSYNPSTNIPKTSVRRSRSRSDRPLFRSRTDKIYCTTLQIQISLFGSFLFYHRPITDLHNETSSVML